MPALHDIRRRIRSVKSTQQITKAMKMVSAAKLRRAQEAMFAARPYARKMMEVLSELAARAPAHAHPLLEERGEDNVLLVVVTADKGLCGGFNANIIRTAARFIDERRGQDLSALIVGRKARDYFKRRALKVRAEHVGVFQALKYETAQTIAREAMDDFTSGKVDRVYLLYNEFKSVIAQKITVEQLLPIPRASKSTPKSRLSTTSTSRDPRESSRTCCRATSRSRSGARSSNRPPPSTGPG